MLPQPDLQTSVDLTQMVMDQIPDMVFVKDEDCRIVYANKALLALYPEAQRDKVIGYTTAEQYDAVEAEEFLKQDRLAFKQGCSEVEETLTFPDGEIRTLHTKKIRFEDNKGIPFILGIARDITFYKQANEELTRSNKELERFAYIASHDLQEPLRKIGGFTQRMERYLADQMAEDKKLQTYMQFVTGGVARMHELIAGLLEYSRVTTVEDNVQDVDTNALIEDVSEALSEYIAENDTIIEYNNLPTVAYDKVLLGQVFQNLISNAIRYRSAQSPRIVINAAQQDGFHQFSVQDNGMGMEEKYHCRIFKMFQRLHRKEDIAGTGIGLSLCEKIVERYNGKIWVTSTVGEGSTFYFTIPVNGVAND